jgi:hypothetical protein
MPEQKTIVGALGAVALVAATTLAVTRKDPPLPPAEGPPASAADAGTARASFNYPGWMSLSTKERGDRVRRCAKTVPHKDSDPASTQAFNACLIGNEAGAP